MNDIADLGGELARVDPRNVARYLRARGWTPQDRTWRGAGIWRSRSGTEVALPSAIQFDDDTELVGRVLRIVAVREERPVAAVLRDVAGPLLDVQRFRTDPPGPTGTTPLLSGYKAFDGVKRAFDTAARAVLDPDEAPGGHGRGRSREVTSFLRTVRLGPTQAGSYVVTTRVPLGPGSGRPDEAWSLQTTLFTGPAAGETVPSENPVGRRVILRMNAAMGAANAALRAADQGRATREDRFAGFDEAMGQGVTSHLCDALALLGGDDKDRAFGVGFEWAPVLPVQEDTHGEIAFAPGSARTLTDAAHHLREIEQAGTATVVGRVIASHSRSPFEGGAVKVEGELLPSRSRRQRRIWVRLEHDAYRRALDAHRGGVQVRASGRFERRENRQELQADQFALE